MRNFGSPPNTRPVFGKPHTPGREVSAANWSNRRRLADDLLAVVTGPSATDPEKVADVLEVLERWHQRVPPGPERRRDAEAMRTARREVRRRLAAQLS